MHNGSAPPPSLFTAAERRIISGCDTPPRVQRFLNALPYNTEPPPERAKLRSFRGVVRYRTAHCLEAALAAAVYPRHCGKFRYFAAPVFKHAVCRQEAQKKAAGAEQNMSWNRGGTAMWRGESLQGTGKFFAISCTKTR